MIILFFYDKKISVLLCNISLTINDETSQLNQTNIDTEDTSVIAYFHLEDMEKLTVSVDIECKNTHNSDSGDVSVYCEKQYDIIISDPTHNDELASLLLILTAAGALSIAGLIVPIIIFTKKGRNL